MFCPKCGAQSADGAAFCGGCGTRLNQPQAAQPVRPAQPARPVQPAYAAQPVPPAAPRKQNSGKPVLVLITMLISLALIVVSVFTALNTAFYKIPVFSLVMTLADGKDDVDDLLDSMDATIEELEDDLDYQEDVMDSDEFEAAEEAIKSMKKLHSNFSVSNARSMVKLIEDIDDDFDIGIDEDEFAEINLLLNVVVCVVIAFFVLPVLFVLLGGLKKSVGLTITGMVFTAISQLIFSGLLWVALSLAVGIVQVLLCQQLKKSRMPA